MANSDPARECAVANAADIPFDESTGDDWFKISPYGVFPGSSPNRPQYFAKPQADAIVAEFNSLRGKLGQQNQTEGYWIYPSPKWDTAAGTERFAPDRLLRVGRLSVAPPLFPLRVVTAMALEFQRDVLDLAVAGP